MITQNADKQNTVAEVPVKGVGTGELVRPISREDVLNLKIGELMLHRGFVTSALEKLSKGARPMGKSGIQIAVLADDVDELLRRCEDMHNVSWPNNPVSRTDANT